MAFEKKTYKRSIILKYIFWNEGMAFCPVVKKLKLGRVYNNNNNDKERTNFDQDSGPRGYAKASYNEV